MIALVSLDPEPYGLVSQTAKPWGMNFTVKGSGNSIPGVLPHTSCGAFRRKVRPWQDHRHRTGIERHGIKFQT